MQMWLQTIRAVLNSRRLLRGVELVAVSLLGGWLGLVVAANVETDVGPVTTRMSLEPTLRGDSELVVSPLGSVTLDSHDGPFQFRVNVTQLKIQDAREIFNDPQVLQGLGKRVTEDVQAGLVRLIVQSAVAVPLSAAALTFLVFRKTRPAAVASGVSLSVLLAGGAIAGLTWNPKSVLEPRYTGLLASAPSVVGTAESIVASFGTYEQELARLVTNVSRLYDVTSTLPVFDPGNSTIRVLHVSDVHLNPTSWEVMRSVAEQFEIDFIIDTGDLSDHGSPPENRVASEIPTLGVPYVFVRGNHDSIGTQKAVARQPNAIVLDGGKTVTVEGLRVIGAGDPRFTPDRSVPQDHRDVVIDLGEQLAERVREAERAQDAEPANTERASAESPAVESPDAGPPAVDIAAVHDAWAAKPLDGVVPLVLAGHTHQRSTRMLHDGTRLFIQGSTGGAGLRALESDEPTPIQCSVLYFDRTTKELQAWDDITLGGLGLASAEISRQLAQQPHPEASETPTPPAASRSPTPTAPGTAGERAEQTP
ncbi:MAG: metallophosphoesterase family protein [Carbonactinosporaceae bacterium]